MLSQLGGGGVKSPSTLIVACQFARLPGDVCGHVYFLFGCLWLLVSLVWVGLRCVALRCVALFVSLFVLPDPNEE